MLYISARLRMHAYRMHACMQCIGAPPKLDVETCTAVIIIWQVQNGNPTRAYRLRRLQTKLMCSHPSSIRRDDSQASAWSRVL